MLNLVLFGPPGAGKGTQAAFLKDSFQLIHISTGDLLRTQIAAKTELGLQAKAFIDKGELASDEVVIAMINSHIEENPDTKGFIFDGFPRTVEQAKALDALLKDRNTPVSGMLALDVKKKELIDRLIERGKTSGRSDDCQESIIRNRIVVYNKKTAPLIDYYSAQNKYYPINGMGSIDEIADRIKLLVQKL
ncbi:MAG TPA: adenylate kinase [Prolixibacteraceae bacterium]|nr:adenylate kinase [Prolixibacteraceae bacterium]